MKHLHCLKRDSKDYEVMKHRTSPSKLDSTACQLGWWEYDISSYFYAFFIFSLFKRSHHRACNKYFWLGIPNKSHWVVSSTLLPTANHVRQEWYMLHSSVQRKTPNVYQKPNHYKPGCKLLIYHFILFSFFWETQLRKKKNNPDQIHRWGDNYIPPTQNPTN